MRRAGRLAARRRRTAPPRRIEGLPRRRRHVDARVRARAGRHLPSAGADRRDRATRRHDDLEDAVHLHAPDVPLVAPGQGVTAIGRRAGLAAMVIGLPLFTAYAYICLTYYDGALAVPALRLLPRPSIAGIAIYSAWLILQVGLYVLLPGRMRSGTALEDGTRLTYRMNGWLAFWCTCALSAGAVWSGLVSPTIGYDQFGPLLVAANVVAFITAAAVLVGRPFMGRRSLADYVMGARLNPRIRG